MVIEDGKPVGVLTRADLLAFLANIRGGRSRGGRRTGGRRELPVRDGRRAVRRRPSTGDVSHSRALLHVRIGRARPARPVAPAHSLA